MTPDEIALATRTHDEVMVGGHYEVIDEIYDENFVNRSPGLPDEQRRGLAAVHAHNRFVRDAFADIELTNGDPVIDGDLLGFRWVFSATHQGNFLGVPPTGRRITIDGLDIMRIRSGKIVEAWVYQDAIGLLRQLQDAPPVAAAER